MYYNAEDCGESRCIAIGPIKSRTDDLLQYGRLRRKSMYHDWSDQSDVYSSYQSYQSYQRVKDVLNQNKLITTKLSVPGAKVCVVAIRCHCVLCSVFVRR
ncbi:hypothetical protein DPMN_072877 [Dreissena polymorpha]|uniref:Uncharacterized protein n=1 Tax=Dreissena polymorpha TaxID=45954 RepID=A0A9D4HA26_DREPO|nr:hypothetical protein DPMN_072877 [Dreissena polymorpha]